MIYYHGCVDIPDAVIVVADTIKHLNYRTSTPAKFRKNHLTEDLASVLMADISRSIAIPVGQLDYVYFSACCGAEPHVDLLDPSKFDSMTYIVPIILPPGRNSIKTSSRYGGEESCEVAVGHIYSFDHTCEHSMTVEDQESGCVVIMIARKL
jgi:hypothetical protein